MQSIYSRYLSTIKSILPRGYQREIAESLADVSLSQIKRAFSGRAVGEEALGKIYSKAVLIAEESASRNVREQRRLQRIMRKIKQAV